MPVSPGFWSGAAQLSKCTVSQWDSMPGATPKEQLANSPEEEQEAWTHSAEQRPSQASITLRLLAVTVLGLTCGWLAYNGSYLLHLHHIQLPLHHQHRNTAFCAFIGCTGDLEEIPGSVAAPSTSPALLPSLSSKSTASDVISKAGSIGSTEKQLAQTLQILSTRVCGSPAVDGYAHVVPSCLETSPTSKWWQAYYQAGGKQSQLVAHIEEAADYDGLAVKWGIKNTVATAQECAQQCLSHMPKDIPGPFTNLPCNAFAFCPVDNCFEPDAHSHSRGDCWLKFTEAPAAPEVNMRGDLPADYRQRHASAPARVQWISGVLLPPGIKPSNGTWSPRWKW